MKREKRRKKKGEKKNDIGEGLIYKFLLEVKREKKQNDAESVFFSIIRYIYSSIMKIDIVINRKVERLYEEYMTLIEELKAMTKEERIELYSGMTKTLFPHAKKVVDLEDQLNEERKDYQRKFKEWFFVICDWSFSNAHFGETCFDLFKKEIVKKSKKDKQSSKIYAHKVILALGLMGYLECVEDNYSHSMKGAHGYNYRVDLFKWVELAKSVSRGNVSVSLDIDVDWAGYEDWFGERQYKTFSLMSVKPNIYEQAKNYLDEFDEYFYTTTLKEDEKKHLTDKWSAAKAITAIAEHDNYFMLRHSDDSEKNDEDKLIHNAGRYYHCLTNVKGDVRKECLLLDGEPVVEVDVSAAQPTMLGLLLREQYPNIKSAWLAHCEKGDFYEWVGRMVLGRGITKEERQVIKTLVMRMLYTAMKPTEKRDETPFWWYLKKYLKETNPSKKERLEDGGLFKTFDFMIMNYLKAEEPNLYKLVYDARTNLKEVKRKKPTARGKTTKKRNNLSIRMTEMEVKYIKACLKAIAPDVRYFYTIHDCIGCKASDAEKVKDAMLVVAKDMFNANLNIKLESGTGKTILDDFKFIPEEVVMKKNSWNSEKKAA